jgi:hypothetical protein
VKFIRVVSQITSNQTNFFFIETRKKITLSNLMGSIEALKEKTMTAFTINTNNK